MGITTRSGRTNITVGCHQMNRKTDTGKTLKRWPVFVDHYKACNSVPVYALHWADTLHERHRSMVFSQQVQSSAPSEFYRCERYEDVPSYSNAAILPAVPSGHQQKDLR